ncbi:MAG: undecaprenyl-diphosphate phosphatase [Oscillospiraceae bacterium]|nr:undecaprenyl-diphosphate phosphatase [Oscillospiraceae bacterium]
MGNLQAFFYGLLQGIAEFLPISSSGHLALAHNFFGAAEADNLAFDILLHLATLFAVLIMLRREVFLVIRGFFSLLRKLFTGKLWGQKKEQLALDERLFLMLCLATLPLIPIVLLSDRVEAIGNFSWIVGILLIINGGMLWLSDRIASGKLTLENAGWLRPFLVGCVQVFGVLPGISRSGSTITGGRFCNFTREDAVRFSFLMSIPAILGACVLKLPDFLNDGVDLAPCIIGSLTAFVVGLGAIRLLQFFSRKKGFTVFSIYSVLIGIAAIVADLVI